MQIIFTPIQIRDKDKVLNLFKEAADKIFRMGIDHWQYWKNPPPEKIQWVEEGILNGEFFFTQNEGGETLGMVRVLQEDILYWGKQEEKAVYVHSLVVREQFKGQQIGKLVLQNIEKEAKNNNCRFIRLDADSKNPKLCTYYEKLGFELVGNKSLPMSIYNLYQKEIV
jgi:ribosomal protein S18 acetylase RimI-like enzyme